VAAAPKGPVKMPDEAPPLNYFALAAVVVACLALIPALNWFGLLAVICGVIGWLQLQSFNTPLKWVALAGMMVGGAMFAIGLIKVLNKPKGPSPKRTELRQESRPNLRASVWHHNGAFPMRSA
jgi:membrane protein implicated in regulation of membrane protease activity